MSRKGENVDGENDKASVSHNRIQYQMLENGVQFGTFELIILRLFRFSDFVLRI